MLRVFFLLTAFGILLIVSIAGFRGQKSGRPPIEVFPDMDRQPKVKAQDPSTFFADGRGARDPVDGTVPLGYVMPQHRPVDGGTGGDTGPYGAMRFSSSTDYVQSGMMGDRWGTGMPFAVDAALLEHGRERYTIFCAVCHGDTGAGNGMAKQFGLATVATLLDERIRDMADGEIFHTITHGKNTMLGSGARITVPDRWAIIAYLRALQISQGGATTADVPPARLESLRQQTP
jgi:mono/diheme cytochrome c family protein